ncbi:MAG TPA: hypothetical protein VGH32_04465 [Pirellulales bacterium]
MSDRKRTIIVSGMIAADPGQGGATWAVLQYVLGLRRLGHDVYFVEPLPAKSLRKSGRPSVGAVSGSGDPDTTPGSADTELSASTLHDSINAAYFRAVADQYGLRDRASLLLAGTRETFGLPYDELVAVGRRADALVNISGMLTDEAILAAIPVRIYLDLDPAFNQLWHNQGIEMRLAGHTHFVTIGQTIGQADCPIPTCGVSWIATNQPIVLEHWPACDTIDFDALTTVGNWRGYGSITHDGVFYGQKAHSLRPFMSLPRKTKEKFILAMGIHPDEVQDLKSLNENGWELVDPIEVAGTPAAYQRFILESKAEFGIAKSGYVAARCGWFSDRSVCYLASGRPVIAQQTGFTRFLPAGEGLFAFESIDDVLAAIDAVRSDYKRHSRAARSLAAEFFDSDMVLSRLLRLTGVVS